MLQSCGPSSRSFAPAVLVALVVAAALAGPAAGTVRAAEWTSGGPEIGWIRDLLVAFDGDLYAATFGGGIFRSADGGRTWTEAGSNIRDAVVIDLDESPESPYFTYGATADRSFLRRQTGADFWAPLGGFPIGVSPPGLSLETFPTRETRVAFGSEFGVFVSNSYGADWPDTLNFAAGQSVNDLLVVPELPNTIHAATPFELIVTSDTGASEQFYSEGLAPITFLIDLEAWSSGADSILVADQRGPLWQFVDRERFVEVGPTEAAPRSNKYFTRIDPDDPDRILLGSSAGLWRSTDRLQGWELIDDGLEVVAPEVWAIDASRVGATDSLRLGSFTLGFLRTGPGGDGPWTVSNSGLAAAWSRSVHPLPGSTLSGTAHGRLFRSVDEGASWQDVTGGLRTLQIAVAHDTGTAWVVSGSGGVFRSVDDGATWTPVTLAGAITRLNRVVALGDLLLASTNDGLAVSGDDGQSFTPVDAATTGRASFALAVTPAGLIAVGLDGSGAQPPFLAVGSPALGFREIELAPGFEAGIRGLGFVDGGLLVAANGFGGSALYRVQDWEGPADPVFVDLSAGIGDGFFESRDLAVRANVVVLGTTAEGVFRSGDHGANWSEWNEGLPTGRIESVAFAPDPSRAVWVATLGRGVHVRELEVGVPVVVTALRASGGADGVEISLQVGAPGPLRVWRRSPVLGDRLLFDGPASDRLVLRDELPAAADPLVAVAYAVEVEVGGGWVETTRIERQLRDLVPPLQSRFVSAVPNPFNPRTELHFELARAGRVRIEVFDTRGRRVRALLDRELAAGPQSPGFDGRDDAGAVLASGVYFVRISTAEGTLTGRMTLVR